jgi:NAD(P)H dehydrogenase (quinone)
MNKPKLLVTAATGKTGLATALQLLEKGYPVRAMVHRLDLRRELLRKAGAEIAKGSLEDMADLRSALAGVSRAYYCPPLMPGALRRAMLFATAAQGAKLEVIVALSQWISDPLHPAIHSREKWLTAKAFEWVPSIDIVTINSGFFADNYLMALEPNAHFGLMAMPLGDGLNAPPSNDGYRPGYRGRLNQSDAPHWQKLASNRSPIVISCGNCVDHRVSAWSAPLPSAPRQMRCATLVKRSQKALRLLLDDM